MKNKKDCTIVEWVDTILSMLETDSSSEKVCRDEDARCTDDSEDNECCGGKCMEATYSAREYDELLRFLLRQIKAIDVDVKESDKDKIVSATIIYKNGSETDCKLPRKLLDYLIDRLNGLFHKHDRQIINGKDCFLWFEEENINMRKYTDTELLEKVLPMLRYSIDYCGDKDNDIIDIKILESINSRAVNKSFVVALQNRINELAKKTRVESTNLIVDEEDTECVEKCNAEDKDIGCCPSEDACEDTDARCVSIDEEGVERTNRRWGDCVEATYSSKEYYELKKECMKKDHEINKLRKTVEALEYLIYNCIPKDDRRKD